MKSHQDFYSLDKLKCIRILYFLSKLYLNWVKILLMILRHKDVYFKNKIKEYEKRIFEEKLNFIKILIFFVYFLKYISLEKVINWIKFVSFLMRLV